MTLLHPRVEPTHTDEPDAEALIREARRLRRRRWALGGAVALVAATAVGAGLAASYSHPGATPNNAQARATGRASASTLPTGPTVTLDLAGSLAVSPSGALYVAAPSQHRILVRLSNGTFKVVAGSGTNGYSGNGGKAIDAELSDPTDLTFDSHGNLYFVDNGRVRVVKTDGVIETVAGDGSSSRPLGSHPIEKVANGTPALQASFHSVPSIAFGPGGTLYIATDAQILRRTKAGRLDVIPTHRVSFAKTPGMPTSLDMGLGTLAVAEDGSVYVAGFNGWAIWRVAPGGAATYVGYDRGSGGSVPDLASGPAGAVYAATGGGISRLTPTRLVPFDHLLEVDGSYFWPMDFAFAPNGTLYVDELPGSIGFEARQKLVARSSGKTALLWTEPSSVAARHLQ